MARLDSLTIDIKEIRRRISNLERINQAIILQFGGIILDGTTGTMTSTTTSDTKANFFSLQKSVDSVITEVARIDFRSRTILGFLENTLDVNSREATDANRITYNSLAIYDQDSVRQLIFEMQKTVTANVFTGASINFSLSGVSSSFNVQIDDTSGNGYMKIPYRASDPVGASAGTIYFSSALGVFRILDNSGWRSL